MFLTLQIWCATFACCCCLLRLLSSLLSTLCCCLYWASFDQYLYPSYISCLFGCPPKTWDHSKDHTCSSLSLVGLQQQYAQFGGQFTSIGVPHAYGVPLRIKWRWIAPKISDCPTRTNTAHLGNQLPLSEGHGSIFLVQVWRTDCDRFWVFGGMRIWPLRKRFYSSVSKCMLAIETVASKSILPGPMCSSHTTFGFAAALLQPRPTPGHGRSFPKEKPWKILENLRNL